MTNLLYIAWVDYRDYKLHCLRLPNVAVIFVFAMRNGCDVKEWDVRVGFADGSINSLWSMDGPDKVRCSG